MPRLVETAVGEGGVLGTPYRPRATSWGLPRPSGSRSFGMLAESAQWATIEPEAVSVMPPISSSRSDELRRIAERHGIDRVRVFGSYARGEAGPDSDIDLLIRLLPGHGFSDFIAFCDEAEAALGRHVDVVTEDGLSPFLRDRVLAEATPL
jgi:uncharacterized protein